MSALEILTKLKEYADEWAEIMSDVLAEGETEGIVEIMIVRQGLLRIGADLTAHNGWSRG